MTNTVPPNFRLSLADLATALGLIAAATSACAYAYGLGYFFSIEPRFLSVFSFSDLIMLFTSSLSTMIFFSIAVGPSVLLILSRNILKDAFADESMLKFKPDQSASSQKPEKTTSQSFNKEFIAAFAIMVLVLFFLMIVIIQDFQSSDPASFSPLPEFLMVFSLPILALSLNKRRNLRIAGATLTPLFLLAAVYVAGDVAGRRDRYENGKIRGLPCAFIKNQRACYDLLFAGSEVVLLRGNGHTIVLAREKLSSIQNRSSQNH
ncbi:hypothetical protein V6R86_13735 [Sphingomonas kaistensis]|uniref:Uncharacterized protein n=1 Tax=Sphingomonas kaistensis TaxID=298708 RepID=A0ABZ2G5A6_9SPHN